MDKQTQEKTISELQREDLNLETILNKRSENNERLQKTLNVDQSLLDTAKKENQSLKETISGLQLDLEFKSKNLDVKRESLESLLEKKKNIENRVRFLF